MGAEAGQPLDAILRRKELERLAGNGTFAWGIGSSLGESANIARQSTQEGKVDILFSPMKSAPKAIDTKPTQQLLWLAYHHPTNGLVDLPAHMLITSRGNDANGPAKRSHYALFCERHDEIHEEGEQGIVDADRARNLVSMNPLGASQVTSMVRYIDGAPAQHPSKPYNILFRAQMHQEGFVRLGVPVTLDDSLLSAYQALCKVQNVKDWLSGVISLKRQAMACLFEQQRQNNLPL